MKKRFDINVTEYDIEYGERGSIGYCPIALAIKRTYPNSHPIICETSFSVSELIDGRHVTYHGDLPLTAQRFIQIFDGFGPGAGTPEPATFRLTATSI